MNVFVFVRALFLHLSHPTWVSLQPQNVKETHGGTKVADVFNCSQHRQSDINFKDSAQLK